MRPLDAPLPTRSSTLLHTARRYNTVLTHHCMCACLCTPIAAPVNYDRTYDPEASFPPPEPQNTTTPHTDLPKGSSPVVIRPSQPQPTFPT
ncbi:hypothetical protein BS50DRAFT_331273 [Corynespora cassiicola Philippines]|uniref:Uncharacterized protein n=1 Tax=Corynespora cassiicola Philippines TaxID=1448308 RepID=A0A2T2NUH8_CORCC|nr:hypothetical protein BS50DRAFT_331273 [Corynespora cassiicola Philippines]